jgi:SPP1 gp7 family putative phage head morphogenesis protein
MLDNFGLDESFLKGLSDHILNTLVTVESLGRSLIKRKDETTAARTVAARQNWFVCDDNIVRVAFDLIPEEALKFLREKALTIAGVEHQQALLDVQKILVQAVQQGRTFDQVKAEIDKLFENYGITKLNPWHLETIFRTNIFTSYAVGQEEQARSMIDQFPLWRYSAIKDFRTRPEHLALDGSIYKVGEGPVPPIDYNCRCTAIYLHVSQVESQGLKPLDWEGDPDFVRFTSRRAWENWTASRQDALTPEIQAWIQANL